MAEDELNDVQEERNDAHASKPAPEVNNNPIIEYRGYQIQKLPNKQPGFHVSLNGEVKAFKPLLEMHPDFHPSTKPSTAKGWIDEQLDGA